MKKMLLVGLLAVSAGLCFAEDNLPIGGVANASDQQMQQKIDSITAQAQARQDSLDQLSDSLTISRSYRENENVGGDRIKPPSRAEFEKQQAEIDQRIHEIEMEAAALAKKPNARIGMTAKQVRTGTNWGEPDKINDTIDASGSFQQWVYGDEYLYFKNGKLVSIQTSR